MSYEHFLFCFVFLYFFFFFLVSHSKDVWEEIKQFKTEKVMHWNLSCSTNLISPMVLCSQPKPQLGQVAWASQVS